MASSRFLFLFGVIMQCCLGQSNTQISMHESVAQKTLIQQESMEQKLAWQNSKTQTSKDSKQAYSDYLAMQQADQIKTTSNQKSIYEAWQEVLVQNQGIKAQYLNTKNMEKMRLAAKLSYLPQIDLNAFYVHLGSKVQIDLVQDRAAYNKLLQDAQNLPPGQMQQQLVSLLQFYGTPITLLEQDIVVGALNILYPLYTGGARYYGNKLADIALKDSYQALRLKELATFEELVTIYYNVVLAKDMLTTLESAEESALKHYQNAQKLYTLGQIANIELLGAQVAYDKAQSKRRGAQNALEVAQLALDNALQTTQTLPTSSLQINPDIALHTMQYYIDQTLQAYPALKITHNKITMADYSRRLEFGQFMPQVGAFGSFMVTDNRSKMEQMMPNWYLGVAARWSLVSPKGRLQKYQGAKIMQLQATALEIEAIRNMELLVQTTYKQLIYYKAEYESLDSSIALAKENVRLQEKAFMQGVTTSDSVIDARNALTAVMTEQKGIAYKFIVGFAKLQALSGDLNSFFAAQQ